MFSLFSFDALDTALIFGIIILVLYLVFSVRSVLMARDGYILLLSDGVCC